ncbi:MAG: hypothetical protein PHI11_10540 [Gallionella sp.]|nr:hypothetical protein [Gallionella sp.]
MERASVKTLLILSMFLSTPAMAGLFNREPEPPKPVLLEAKTERAALLKQVVDNDSALDKVIQDQSGTGKQVALGKVHVTVLTDTSGGASHSGGLASFGNRTTVGVEANYKLLGVTPEDVQAIADKFYADLKAAFTSQGYEVLAPEKLLADANFKEVVATTKSPEVSGDYIAAAAKQTGLPTGILQNVKFTDLSETLGNVPVIDVDLSLDFAEFQGSGQTNHSLFGGSTVEANLAHSARLSIKEGHINVFFSAGHNEGIQLGNGTIRINMIPFKHVINLPGDIAAGVEEKGSSATDIAWSAIAVLGGNLHKGSRYEVTAVKNYKEVVATNLQPFAEVIAAVLKKQ